MNPYAALVTWTIGIFIWMYLLPILIVGTLLCIPFFMFITPMLAAITFTFIMVFKDEFIVRSPYREYMNNIPYHKWFGHYNTVENPDKPTLITSHDHGVLCMGILLAAHFKPNSKTVFAVAPILFSIPFVGWIAKHVGAIPATEKAICNSLKTTSVIIVPGGIPELITDTPYTRRHGFLRIAQKMDVPILPIKTHTKFYDIVPIGGFDHRIYVAKHYGIPIMFPWVFGWYGTWLPKRNKIEWKALDTFNMQKQDDLEESRKAYYRKIYD